MWPSSTPSYEHFSWHPLCKDSVTFPYQHSYIFCSHLPRCTLTVISSWGEGEGYWEASQLHSQESHRAWAFPCPWSPSTLPWLELMVLQLVGGKVSVTSINDIFFQIQEWVTAVLCEVERTGLTGIGSEQRSWRAAWWIFMTLKALRAKRVTFGEKLEKFW